MKYIISTAILLLSFQSMASISIGSIKKMKGTININRATTSIKPTINSLIFEKDTIQTSKSSFLKIQFNDNSTIIVGPNSELEIQKFSKTKKSVFKFIKGKFRSSISKRVTKETTVTFKTDLASLAIRGTVFLTNSYLVNGKSVTDTALLEGSIQTKIGQTKEFLLEQGQAFNTSKLAQSKGLTKLDSEFVNKLLKNESHFLPNIQNPDGTFKEFKSIEKTNIPKNVKSSLPKAPIVAVTAATTAVVKTPVLKKKNKQKRLDLVTLPWSIRDAILRRDELRKENECFYWIFKRLPGTGQPELFRRERDCDEFEYDL